MAWSRVCLAGSRAAAPRPPAAPVGAQLMARWRLQGRAASSSARYTCPCDSLLLLSNKRLSDSLSCFFQLQIEIVPTLTLQLLDFLKLAVTMHFTKIIN